MRVHVAGDGWKTRFQWLKEGYYVWDGVVGERMWNNCYYSGSTDYFNRDQVFPSERAIEEYRAYVREKRRERYLRWKARKNDLPFPADTLEPCVLPDYAGWAASCSSEGTAVLFLDTETSGLDALCNSLLQLSWQVVDTSDWRVMSEWNFYFQWPSNPQRVVPRAIEVNGLTQERLSELGTSPLFSALHVLFQDLRGCDLLVGHNMGFDLDFILAAAAAFDKRNHTSWASTLKGYFPQQCYCTMSSTVGWCKLPMPNGSYCADGDLPYKYPRLSELATLLDVPFHDLQLHDSSSDVELTKRCFRRLVEMDFGNIRQKL